LKIAAKVDVVDEAYFREQVYPLLDAPDVEFVGELSEQKKGDFLRNASALLFPICWPEPFGLVMIEAMACGTPVLAFDHGSVREVVDEGITGRVVTDFEEAVRSFHLRHGSTGAKSAGASRALLGVAMAQDYVQIYQTQMRSIAYRAPPPRPR
jgi:glycosyltransferase involved in cell wall biosynthesis